MPKTVATPLTSGCVPGPDTATVWTCPTPVYIHTARPGTNNTHTHTHTHSQGDREVCPSATHMSLRKRDRPKPSRNATTPAQTHWCQSTMWRGHTRSTTSPKTGKEGGKSAKSSVLRLTCVPLPHLVLPLSGCACSRSPTMATRGEARGTHDSGSAAIRVSPCQTRIAKSAMAQ